MLAIKNSLFCLSFILALASCGRSPPIKTTEFTGNAMTIDYRIVIGSPLTSEQKQRIDSIIFSTFQEVNAIYNKWNPLSELSTLNNLPAQTPRQLSPKLLKLLQLTDRVVKMTNGRFDPTIEPLQALWKKHLTQGTLPSNEEITTLKPTLGWEKIHLDDGIFTKDRGDVMLDLGGIAKGYAVDLLIDNLTKEQISGIYVEWGGEIKTSGNHPHKRPWKIYISRFEDININNALAIVELEDLALATSGDYLQKWKVGDEEYFHVIDPGSCRALKIGEHTIGSASVACKSCAVADGLATAALTFPTEAEAADWLTGLQIELPELRYWLLTRTESETR